MMHLLIGAKPGLLSTFFSLVKKRFCSPELKHCLNVYSVVLCTLGRDASRRRRSPETTERRHEAGRSGCSFPLLSLPVRDASRRRRSPETTERRHEAGRSGCSFPLLSLPVRDASRRRRGRDTRDGWDEPLRSVLGRADPEQGPP